jgi:signal transduction histidine kinase
MLHEFIEANQGAIIVRTRERVRCRPWPSVSPLELDDSVPLFLTHLLEVLQSTAMAAAVPSDAMISSAAQHGRQLLEAGFSIAQVVHGYGDICQVITELAIEQNAPITVAEFRTLNACLDTAIAEAVTTHTRLSAEQRSASEIERLGHAAHELRDLLNTALLAFHSLQRGSLSVNGNTGAVLGRSLGHLRDVIDRSLSEVRLAAGTLQRQRLRVLDFLEEIGAIGAIHSESRRVGLTIEPVDAALAVDADPQLLTSAIMNLLHNAFKNTPAGGHVVLRTRAEQQRLVLEIEDECGGIPDSKTDLFAAFGHRRGADTSGLGLGLSIAKKAVAAHDGDIFVRNMPGKGCVFTIRVPLAG